LQQYKQQIAEPPPPGSVLPKSKAVEKPVNAGEVKITVKKFVYHGNSRFSTEQLDRLVASYLNHPINMEDLQSATEAISEAYHKQGWVVRVYLPRQDVTNGIVNINIQEARYGGLQIQGSAPKRITETRLQKYIEMGLKPGQLVNLDNLDRPLLLVNDLPGVGISASLHAGKEVNETDLVIEFKRDELFNGNVTANNAGSNSTGHNQLLTNLALNSPTRIGDQLTTNIINSRGSNYGQLGYSLPLGEDGWRVGVNGSWMTYRWKVGQLAPLKGSGNSKVASANASYPLIRRDAGSLYFSTQANHEVFYNKTIFGTTSDYSVNNMLLSLYGNYQGYANAITTAGVTYTTGRVKINKTMADRDTVPRGDYNKARYYISRQQPLINRLRLDLTYTGQIADKNLDSSEQFYLGGMSAVRAYPSGEGSGTEGKVFNAELRLDLPYQFTISTFYDWGRIQQMLRNSAGVTPNKYNLSGYGLTLSKKTDIGLELSATWAHRIGSNPNPTATGNDQDGTLKKNRWWLQGSWTF
ncbi:MAG: ShlB/FhaC/HecB family hemolysin secretion/activation protein, partial [Enterobacteriaceae bacterium]